MLDSFAYGRSFFMRVYIDGSAGTTGLALEGRLLGLDYVELIKPDGSLRKDVETRKKYLNEADIVFLCLPDDAAKEAVSFVENENTVVIDASTAHRTAQGWAYGFPELSLEHHNAVKKSNRIAIPGCHASGFAAIVYPAVAGGFIKKDETVYCCSLTGYSGGGKTMIAEYELDGAKNSAAKLYSLGLKHKHLPEMKHVCGLENFPVFVPTLINSHSGMIVSVPFGNFPAIKIHEYYSNYYKDSPTVSIMPFNEAAELELEGMNGKDGMEIYVCGNENQTMLAARFDNLGKGSSGAAVQCMKVRMGYE